MKIREINITDFFCHNRIRLCAFLSVVVLLLPGLCQAAGPSADYLEYCVNDIIKDKYTEAECWSCGVIFALMKSMMEIIEIIYEVVKEISTLILVLGASIWIAVYLLKALGSFAMQEPAKIIDGLLVFGFKIAFIYFLIVDGLDQVIKYIVLPILDVGFDIGEVFSENAGLGG